MMTDTSINEKGRMIIASHMNERQKALVIFISSMLFISVVTFLGVVLEDAAMVTDFSRSNLAPCCKYPLGTDFMGRNMLPRTLCGLSLSIRIGLLTSVVSAVVALILGTLSAIGGRTVDSVVTWVIDLVMGVPHILLLILISYACGKGFFGVVVGITLSHWMSLSRVIRGEIIQLRESGYVKVASKLGVSKLRIAYRHMLPHVLPQFTVGMVLLFPHAILHEASITFLGFGLPAEQPAIGVILSESMRYLATGQWWVAVFPGLFLVLTVMMFDIAGKSLRKLLDPSSTHE